MGQKNIQIGDIVWHDLNVEYAQDVRDFYSKVVGWQSSAVSMGEYSDFNMNKPDSGETVAGVCHARGANAVLPAQWLMYVKVADAQYSADQCQLLGGKILSGPVTMGEQTYYTIEDPAGACMAIFSDVEGVEAKG